MYTCARTHVVVFENLKKASLFSGISHIAAAPYHLLQVKLRSELRHHGSASVESESRESVDSDYRSIWSC